MNKIDRGKKLQNVECIMRSIGSRRSFALFTCIPNQPLIPKINLLKGSVTPRIFLCHGEEQERKRNEWLSLGLWDFECFFPNPCTCIPYVRFHRVSTNFPRFGYTVCVQERFPDTWTLETLPERPAPRRVPSRSRTSSLLSDLLCI